MTSVFKDSSPFQHIHKHSSPLQQALDTQIANRHIQQIVSVGGFLQSSPQPHEPDQCRGPHAHIKVTHTLLVDYGVAMGKSKQANEFECHGHPINNKVEPGLILLQGTVTSP